MKGLTPSSSCSENSGRGVAAVTHAALEVFGLRLSSVKFALGQAASSSLVTSSELKLIEVAGVTPA
jgi:hypothetical protein